MAVLARASSAVQDQPDEQRDRERPQQLAEGEVRVGRAGEDSSTPGVSLAGGSAATLASSSGEAGTPAIQPPPVAPPVSAAPRWAAPPPRPPPGAAGDHGRGRSRRGRARELLLAASAAAAASARGSGWPQARGDRARRWRGPAAAASRSGPVPVIVELARVDALGVVAGAGQQQPVQRAPRGQFLVRALVDQAPGIQYRDLVGELERGAAVGDQQRGAARPSPCAASRGSAPRPSRRSRRSRRRGSGSAGR